MGYIIGGGTNHGRIQLLQKKDRAGGGGKKETAKPPEPHRRADRGDFPHGEEDRYCDDILIQLSAVNKSIKSLANHIVENHMYRCVLSDIEKGHYDT